MCLPTSTTGSSEGPGEVVLKLLSKYYQIIVQGAGSFKGNSRVKLRSAWFRAILLAGKIRIANHIAANQHSINLRGKFSLYDGRQICTF